MAARSSKDSARQPGAAAAAASIAAATSSSVALPRWPSTWRWLCGSTTSIRSPPPIRGRPPTVMVSSACSPAISLTLASSTARSWLPGAYCLTGSFTGAGTFVTASMADLPVVAQRQQRPPDATNGSSHRRTVFPARCCSPGVARTALLAQCLSHSASRTGRAGSPTCADRQLVTTYALLSRPVPGGTLRDSSDAQGGPMWQIMLGAASPMSPGQLCQPTWRCRPAEPSDASSADRCPRRGQGNTGAATCRAVRDRAHLQRRPAAPARQGAHVARADDQVLHRQRRSGPGWRGHGHAAQACRRGRRGPWLCPRWLPADRRAGEGRLYRGPEPGG